MRISLAKLFFGAIAVKLGWGTGKVLILVASKLATDKEAHKRIKDAYAKGSADFEQGKQKAKMRLISDDVEVPPPSSDDWAKWAEKLKQTDDPENRP